MVLFYHFAFLAISIALLGLGAGGVFAYLLKARLAKTATRTLAARLSGSTRSVVWVVLEIVLNIPVALEVSSEKFLQLSASLLAAAVPFFLTGLLSRSSCARTWRVPTLYGADLSGGALACLAVVPLLNWLGGPEYDSGGRRCNGAAGHDLGSILKRRKLAGGLVVLFVVLIAANHSNRLIDVIYAKGMFRDRAWVEFARWNALSRVEVIARARQRPSSSTPTLPLTS